MSHQVPWNKIILEEFIRLAILSKDEEAVMRTRVAGWTRVEQSMKLGMSLAKVDKITARLKEKYDGVQRTALFYRRAKPVRKKHTWTLTNFWSKVV